jgi:tetratricopeptide (TPR) repeat protein
MLHSKTRRALEFIDTSAVEEGRPTWSELEEALADARERANVGLASSLTWQMGMRLSSIATMSRMSSGSDQRKPQWLPSENEALEPAVELFRESLKNALTASDAELEKLARRGLADCYIQAKEFGMALDYLEPLTEMCHMPDDAKLLFEVNQKSGDCYLELEDDGAALNCYEVAMQVARAVDDPFEISTQYGKLASALANLKRYDEAIGAWGASLALLIRIGNEPPLQSKINFHKQLFNTAALPRLIAYTEQRLAHTKEAIGRDLLRELPHKLALAVSYPRQINWSGWPIFRELDVAVRYAITVLARLMENPGDKGFSGESTVAIVGEFVRRQFGEEIPDPDTLPMAARYLMQVDRTRRAANYVKIAEQTRAGPGPSGGGSSGHVLYLRSFIASPKLPRTQLEHWGEVDLEEFIACRLDSSTLIALGDPDLERFGPGRAPASDENWRDVLRVLAIEAQMLLVIPAPTAGTSWELEWVTINKFLHKTCFIMPRPGEGHEGWWAEHWAQLREWSVRLGLDLPEYTPEGCIFRLTSEGQVDQIPFSVIDEAPDLFWALMIRLLYRPNVSWDFAYAMKEAAYDIQKSKQKELTLDERIRAIGIDAVPPESVTALVELEAAPRLELSNWNYDRARVPNAPGIVLLYETPFRLLWAENVDDLRHTLDRYTDGQVADFTRTFFQGRVWNLLKGSQMEQLLDKRLTIESVVSFRVKQLISCRYCALPDAAAREVLVDLIWKGASSFGVPDFYTVSRGAAA